MQKTHLYRWLIGLAMIAVALFPGRGHSWEATFGGTGWDSAESVCQTSDGGYVLVGNTRLFGSENDDLFLVKAEADGSEAWRKTFGGSRDD